jgi:chemotaxis signal transduction protein
MAMDEPRTAAANHYCTFRLDGHLFGFDIRAVREVNMQTAFTSVPHAPPVVRGCVNLRGHIVLVLDLRRLLGLEPAPVTPDSRLVIFKPTVGESLGVLVDAIGDIASVPEDLTENMRPDEAPRVEEETGARRAAELVSGIGKLEGELLVIVNPHKLLGAVAGSVAEIRRT